MQEFENAGSSIPSWRRSESSTTVTRLILGSLSHHGGASNHEALREAPLEESRLGRLFDVHSLGKPSLFFAVPETGAQCQQVLYTVTIALSTVYVLEGGARHIQYLSQDQLSTVLKFNWIGQPFGIMAAASGKTSVGFMVMRITGPKTVWRKWFLYISVGLYIGISIVASTLVFVQCSPTRALWDFSLAAMAKCWKPMVAADVIILQSGMEGLLTLAAIFVDTDLWHSLWHLP